MRCGPPGEHVFMIEHGHGHPVRSRFAKSLSLVIRTRYKFISSTLVPARVLYGTTLRQGRLHKFGAPVRNVKYSRIFENSDN